MGSFYSTCSITDLCITDGDPMYMQLIVPTWVTNPYSIDGEQIDCGEKGLRVSNEGPLAEFIPFGFPIEGYYDDYGNIGGIVRNRNIEMLEKYFGIPIDDIISCATDDRWYKYSYLPGVIEKKEEEYKGQFKGWTVGENKMKHIGILKKLTVTYFRKEHYDFLAENNLETESYYVKENDKRLKKMIDSLKLLEEKRPSSKVEKPEFTINDITNEIRTRYQVIRNTRDSNEKFDKMIIAMENFKDGSWFRNFQYVFYIPSIAKIDMFQLLPIGVEDSKEVERQYSFIMNMRNLYKVIRPSYYGSQEDNFTAYTKFHEMSVNLVNDIAIEKKVDNSLSDIGWILKENLKKIDNPELVEKIKNEITAGLEEYGYKIKLK